MTPKQLEQIEAHGRNLLAIFPNATERDPVKLCKKLRRLDREGAAVALRLCNGPEYAEGEADTLTDDILRRVNRLLGQSANQYTGAPCGCERGIERDNCPQCEGTGKVIDFAKFRRREIVPIFVNQDPRGYALKIDDAWIKKQRQHECGYIGPCTTCPSCVQPTHNIQICKDWGGYGIIAPEIDGK